MQTDVATKEVNFATPETFAQAWQSEYPGPETDIQRVGIEAIGRLASGSSSEVSEAGFTDVLLRDGQQQQTKPLTAEERLEVFEEIVSTGVDRIEIGHLGNENGDQQLASMIIDHIASLDANDDRYEGLKLQVLFGSQEDKIKEGVDVITKAFIRNYPDNWEEEMADRIVVHVYDRVDPNLLATASEPYDIQESAYRVTKAAAHAQSAGFNNFSISGEATSAITAEEAVQYYRSITSQLFDNGAESVNINLPNTYGYSTNHDWNVGTMAAFNASVKHGFEEGRVTTSIHPHNDVDNALDYVNSAFVAGIDRVEGTGPGMGERTGNVALIDVMARILEQARHQIIRERESGQGKERTFAKFAGSVAVSRTIKISPRIVENLYKWYPVSAKISESFGQHALYRFHRTAVGNPYAHDNGSGPHDQAMAAAITNPVQTPGDSNYEWALITNGILGRDTEKIVLGDPHAVDAITVGNHAGGGKTKAIKEGKIKRAEEHTVVQAKEQYKARQQAIIDQLLEGVELVTG